jgi:hypothetical protein
VPTVTCPPAGGGSLVELYPPVPRRAPKRGRGAGIDWLNQRSSVRSRTAGIASAAWQLVRFQTELHHGRCDLRRSAAGRWRFLQRPLPGLFLAE